MEEVEMSEALPNNKLLALELTFLGGVQRAISRPEQKDTGNQANYLFTDIQQVLQKHGMIGIDFFSNISNILAYSSSDQRSIEAATAEIAALLYDSVSLWLISQPVLLDSGHTLDAASMTALQQAGLNNPITRGPLQEAKDALSSPKHRAVFTIIQSFKHFLSTAKQDHAQDSYLPQWLNEILSADNFQAYCDGGASNRRGPAIDDPQAVAQALLSSLNQELAYLTTPEVHVRRVRRKSSSKAMLHFFLFCVLAVGATMTVFGLAGLVEGVYAPFMLFVGANGIGGSALAGVLLAVGVLLVLAAVMGFLFSGDRAAVAPSPQSQERDLDEHSPSVRPRHSNDENLDLGYVPPPSAPPASRQLTLGEEGLLHLLSGRQNNAKNRPWMEWMESAAREAQASAAHAPFRAGSNRFDFGLALLRAIVDWLGALVQALAPMQLLGFQGDQLRAVSLLPGVVQANSGRLSSLPLTSGFGASNEAGERLLQMN